MRRFPFTGIRSAFWPHGILLGACVLWIASNIPKPSPIALQSFLTLALTVGLTLAVTFRNSRFAFILFSLALADLGVSTFSAHRLTLRADPGISAAGAIGTFFALNLLIFGLSAERSVTAIRILKTLVLLFFETLIVLTVVRFAESHSFGALSLSKSALGSAPAAAVLSLTSFGIFGFRAIKNGNALDSGLQWASLAALLALRFPVHMPQVSAYYTATCAILIIALANHSHALAYKDELTQLPSRRAYHEATDRLEHPYSIASADIDHFKSFNDTYGHETGDEVLRLVAGRLAQVTGGGQAYRIGGEEFVIIFAARSVNQIAADLEALRQNIAGAEFKVRTKKERRQSSRGPDRRRTSSKNGSRNATRSDGASTIHSTQVTISIGAAGSRGKLAPKEILELADQALYKAKANGRNRVEISEAVKTPKPARSA